MFLRLFINLFLLAQSMCEQTIITRLLFAADIAIFWPVEVIRIINQMETTIIILIFTAVLCNLCWALLCTLRKRIS